MFFKKINFYNYIFCFISILVLFFFLYEYFFIKSADFKTIFYLLLSFLLSIFFVIVSFLKKDLKKNIFILYLSVFLSLYSVEFFLNFYNKYDELSHIKNRYKLYEERIDYYNYLKKKYSNSAKVRFYVQNLSAEKNLKKYPLSGVKKTKTIHCNENGYYSTYDSDRYGFNNPDMEWNKTIHETVLIGDSFVHGACVFREFSIGGYFRQFLDLNESVINLGWSGSGPLQEYATLKEFYKNFNTKNVIWFFYENDFINLKDELENNILKKYLNTDFTQDYFKKIESFENKLEDTHEIELQKLKKYLNDYKLLDKLKNIKILRFLFLEKTQNLIFNFVQFKIHKKIEIEEDVYDKFRLLLETTLELTKQNGSNFHFVFLPSIKRYKDKNDKDIEYVKLKSIINSLDINFIDINIALNDLVDDPLSIYAMKKNSHYSPYGYKIISKEIYEQIFQQK
jgi:hypothetical protein